MIVLQQLSQHVQNIPDQIAVRAFNTGLQTDHTLSFQELDERARLIASRLETLIPPGERAILAFPTGTEFLCTFLACLYAGVIAVPINVPREDRADPRFLSVLKDANPHYTLTHTSVSKAVQGQCATFSPSYTGGHLCTDTLAGTVADDWQPQEEDIDEIAFLQYTSGSTSAPKGVMITHKALAANIEMMVKSWQTTPDDIMISWLPNFHDMGLIAMLLQAVWVGCPVYIISPHDFIKSPFDWLRLISDHGGTMTAAPNFAYKLCCELATPEILKSLDLSRWKLALNGAEPIDPHTLSTFYKTFAPCGLSLDAIAPGYGLAEACVGVSTSRPDRLYERLDVDAKALAAHKIMPPQSKQDTKTLIGSGTPFVHSHLEIVNPETFKQSKPNTVGEIWVYGPHVASGYWQKEEDTRAVFNQSLAGSDDKRSYLRTGDLGFLRNGELFVTGRIKDLMIIRGRNYYPHDIELIFKTLHKSFNHKDTAAFTVDVDGEEKIVVLQTVPSAFKAQELGPDMVDKFQRELTTQYEITAWCVLLVEDRALPKTTSGKIARRACRQQFLDDTLPVIWQYKTAQIDVKPVSISPPPKGATQADIAVWLETLLISQFGLTKLETDQSIFDLGLDSLKFVQLICSIEVAMDCTIKETDFIKTPTIKGLANVLSGKLPDVSTPKNVDDTSTFDHPSMKLRDRLISHIRWYGPTWGGRPLLPYRFGSSLLYWLVNRKSVQKYAYPAQMKFVEQAVKGVAPDADIRKHVTLNLLVNSWSAWREFSFSDPKTFSKYVSILGQENLDAAFAAGQGVVLACPHTSLKGLIKFIPTLAQKERIAIGKLNQEQLGRYGLSDLAPQLAENGDIQNPVLTFTQLRRAREVLGRKGIAMVFADGYRGKGGINVPFFGRNRPIFPGAADLALRTHAQIIPITLSLASSGKVTITFCPALTAKGDVFEEKINSLLHQYAEHLKSDWATNFAQFDYYALANYAKQPHINSNQKDMI